MKRLFRWVGWRWRLWRAKHWEWVALVQWNEGRSSLGAWERAAHRVQEIRLER